MNLRALAYIVTLSLAIAALRYVTNEWLFVDETTRRRLNALMVVAYLVTLVAIVAKLR